MLTNSTRFKISIFATIILTIVGIFAYIYDPDNIDKFAFYTINMVLPILSYVIGRTIRSGQHEKGLLLQQGTRYRTALISFVVSLMIGIICYVFSPENIDKLGMYMIGVVLPIVGFILGRSFKGEQKRMYEQDYNQYDSYQYFGGNQPQYNYGEYRYDGGIHNKPNRESSSADTPPNTTSEYGAGYSNEEP